MGFNNEFALRMVFDIETAPLDEAATYLEPVTAPANYKDADKIAAYVKDKTAEEVSKCGLDVDLCRVVAVGLWTEDEPTLRIETTETQDEAALLEFFWARATGRPIVGFNCIGFDLPVLFRRSLYLDVRAPRIQIDRYRHPDVIDLAQELSYFGQLRLRGLSFYAKRLGFDVPDPLTGADVPQAVAEGRWLDVRGHLTADIQKTALLAAKLGYFDRVRAMAATSTF